MSDVPTAVFGPKLTEHCKRWQGIFRGYPFPFIATAVTFTAFLARIAVPYIPASYLSKKNNDTLVHYLEQIVFFGVPISIGLYGTWNMIDTLLLSLQQTPLEVCLANWYQGRSGYLQNGLYWLGGKVFSDIYMKERFKALISLSATITEAQLNDAFHNTKNMHDFGKVFNCNL